MDETPTPTLASDFHPEVMRLFNQYVHGAIDRRGFLDGASRHATAGLTAAGLLAALSPNFARAQKVPPADPRIKIETVTLGSPQGSGNVRGYLARPANVTGKLPLVLVIHENRGLNPHIEDIARRLAVDGYLALAPDALTPLGGYPGDEDKARELFGKLDQAKTQEDFLAAAGWLAARPDGNGKLGAVGFCYGGGVVNLLATKLGDRLQAGVPFYGRAPALDQVPAIKAELLLHFAETDDMMNNFWPAYEAALRGAGVRHEAFTYPGTQHGFNNDTTPRHAPAAAALAWDRTMALFKRALA